MPKFRVNVFEVHCSEVIIEAKDEKEAIKKVSDGEGNEVSSAYSHTLDEDTWKVEKIKNKWINLTKKPPLLAVLKAEEQWGTNEN